jgi:glutaredoxin
MFWIITKPNCPHCDRAKALLEKEGKPYQAFSYDTHPMLVKVMMVGGLKTVPQIWDNSTYIGGADELEAYMQRKES